MYLLNSFSLNMLEDLTATVRFTEIDETWATAVLAQSEWASAVGHADTAAVFSQVLRLPVPCNLLSVGLQALAKGRGEVMAERAEVAQDMVRAILREL